MDNTANFIGAIKAKRHEIALSLAEGGAVNIEGYWKLVGQYLGLGEALNTLEEILADQEKEL